VTGTQILIMIQRIQTIFLFLAAACFAILFKAPMATSDKPTAQFLSDQVYTIQDQLLLVGLAVLGTAIALLTIFLFNNRKLQIKLGYLLMVVAIVLPVASFVFLSRDTASQDMTAHIENQWGMFVPVASIVFAALAINAIRKDDKLVKSMASLL
jgi:hypothetical protein